MKKCFSKIGLAAVVLYSIVVVAYYVFCWGSTLCGFYARLNPFLTLPWGRITALLSSKLVSLFFILNYITFYLVGLFLGKVYNRFHWLGLLLITVFFCFLGFLVWFEITSVIPGLKRVY